MEALSIHFRVLYYVWLFHNEDEVKWFYHKIYRILVIINGYYFFASAVVKFLLSLNNVDEFADVVYLIMDCTVYGVNIANFLLRQHKVLKLREMYQQTCFQPQSIIEMKIEKKYSSRYKKIFWILSIFYIFFVAAALISYLVSSTISRYLSTFTCFMKLVHFGSFG